MPKKRRKCRLNPTPSPGEWAPPLPTKGDQPPGRPLGLGLLLEARGDARGGTRHGGDHQGVPLGAHVPGLRRGGVEGPGAGKGFGGWKIFRGLGKKSGSWKEVGGLEKGATGWLPAAG